MLGQSAGILVYVRNLTSTEQDALLGIIEPGLKVDVIGIVDDYFGWVLRPEGHSKGSKTYYPHMRK